jgi:GntR family transcriptional regulator/MocR family aminotransferase
MYPVPLDEDGICIDDLVKKMRKTSNNVLYIQPTNHLPTGTHMTKKRRDSLLDICSKLNTAVLENDMLRDFTYGRLFPKPMKAFDKSDQHIYIGSLLSCFMGYKLSWIVASKQLIDRMRDINTHFELIPNNVMHIVADEMLTKGYYYEYIEKIQLLLKKQYYTVQRLLDKYLSDIANWRRDYPSLFIWLEIKENIDVFKCFLSSREFLFFPGTFCEPKDTNHIRLNIFGVNEDKLEHWIVSISKLLNNNAGKK